MLLEILHQTTITEDHPQIIVLLKDLDLLNEILTIEDTQHLQETHLVLAVTTPEATHRVIHNKAMAADALETHALIAVSESEIGHRLNDKNVNEKFQYVT